MAGKIVRLIVPGFRRYFVPSSVIGGLLALLVGPEVLGRLVPALPGGLIGDEIIDLWRQMPGFLINIVFASLFLGKIVPGLKEIWRRAGPQVAFGQMIAWGQYVVGIGLTILILAPVFGVPPMFGALIEIGFEGGHGTAAGLGPIFREVGWSEGQDLALAVATIGIVLGVVFGMVLINLGIWKNQTKFVTSQGKVKSTVEKYEGDDSLVSRVAGVDADDTGIESMEPLAFHLSYIAIAIGIGYVLLQGLIWLELTFLVSRGAPVLLGHIPLFPLAMLGGVVVQKIHSRFFKDVMLSRDLVLRIQGAALDFLILSALATLTLSALAESWAPLLILVIGGILWNLCAFLFLARRMLPNFWFERAIGDFGQSMGVTATGLLLMRVVDPDAESPAFEAFGYKQLLFEPFVGGGFFTAMSVPLLFNFGSMTVLAITGGLMVFWLLLGLLVFGRKRKSK